MFLDINLLILLKYSYLFNFFFPFFVFIHFLFLFPFYLDPWPHVGGCTLLPPCCLGSGLEHGIQMFCLLVDRGFSPRSLCPAFTPAEYSLGPSYWWLLGLWFSQIGPLFFCRLRWPNYFLVLAYHGLGDIRVFGIGNSLVGTHPGMIGTFDFFGRFL